MTTNTTKVWVSKWALGKGIEECDADVSHGYASFNYSHFRMGIDAHLTLSDAIDAAEKARIKKIASLRKQLVKLEALRFTGVNK